MERKSELLMPAGSLVKLKTAILYGADAVYAGTPDMSLRVQSKFSLEDLQEGIKFVHEHGKKIYLTLNLFAHNKDIEKLPVFVETLRDLKPDGVIMADPGVFSYVKKHAPELKCHVSTQANVCSSLTVDYWKEQGASLCVLGREVSFEELKEIREKCQDIEIEVFTHGAMCMSYSGRCLLSNFMAERGANQGNCAHSCRWHYKLHLKMKDGSVKEVEINEYNKNDFQFMLQEEFRPDELYELVEDEHGSYIMSSKDLCLMPRLNDLLEIGVDSLKVEGRNKSEYYTAITARAYRNAIDAWKKDKENWDFRKYQAELFTLQNRGYTLGFFEGRLTNVSQNYDFTRTLGDWLFAGSIIEWQGDDIIFMNRNEIKTGDVLEFLSPNDMKSINIKIDEIIDADSDDMYSKISAGLGKRIRISTKNIDMNTKDLKELLPVLSIARKPSYISGERQEMLMKNLNSFAGELGVEYGEIVKTFRDADNASSAEVHSCGGNCKSCVSCK